MAEQLNTDTYGNSSCTETPASIWVRDEEIFAETGARVMRRNPDVDAHTAQQLVIDRKIAAYGARNNPVLRGVIERAILER